MHNWRFIVIKNNFKDCLIFHNFFLLYMILPNTFFPNVFRFHFSLLLNIFNTHSNCISNLELFQKYANIYTEMRCEVCQGLRGCDFLHYWSIASQLSSAVWTTHHSPADFPICSQSSSPKHVKSDTYFLNPSQTALSALPAVTITPYKTLTRNSDLNCSKLTPQVQTIDID